MTLLLTHIGIYSTQDFQIFLHHTYSFAAAECFMPQYVPHYNISQASNINIKFAILRHPRTSGVSMSIPSRSTCQRSAQSRRRALFGSQACCPSAFRAKSSEPEQKPQGYQVLLQSQPGPLVSAAPISLGRLHSSSANQWLSHTFPASSQPLPPLTLAS